ncbi:YrrS family protein [Sporosarcina limicola]|uniref:DUF1510 domain-containing protein n=1 Tax=Sporosarcina limicola TaxID=34101 RepID=A0A927MHC4_9BACL|nr:YrrS family protein [Sporosarcina limicola]MBE1554633.1 hypothetical protein [Sporosarcina limicola]
MTEREPDFSRVSRKKGRNRPNNVLNILICIVVVLIVVLATPIFLGNKDDGQADGKKPPVGEGNPEGIQRDDEKKADESDGNLSMDKEDSTEDKETSKDTGKSDSTVAKGADKSKETKPENATDKGKTDSDSEDPGTVTYIPSGDAVISETVVDTAWQPVGTTQTGNHVSQYDGASVDWNEKKQALAYATGLPQDSMIFWKIKNGGNPQKAVGVVSSRDSVDKYRVYLEWVDGQGWQPVKMDVLNTLEFDY